MVGPRTTARVVLADRRTSSEAPQIDVDELVCGADLGTASAEAPAMKDRTVPMTLKERTIVQVIRSFQSGL